MSQALSMQARRWRTIMVTVPIIGATSCEQDITIHYSFIAFELTVFYFFFDDVISDVLYQRLAVGVPQRTFDKAGLDAGSTSRPSSKSDGTNVNSRSSESS